MKLHIQTGDQGYPIVFNQSFDQLVDELKNNTSLAKQICLVTDENVDALYGELVENTLLGLGSQLVKYVFGPGEESKNLDTIKEIYNLCLDNHFDRQSLVVALGGGIVGDVAGFVASTYMRGIDFIQIPTSLLAQNDSSVGGKVGVNLHKHKNMIGAFYQPKLVYMNTEVLASLPAREFASGMSEVIKHGLIRDQSFYNYLIDHLDSIKDLDHDTIANMNYISCSIKGDVVSQDEKEGSIRKILNFGHTIGHAIETLSNFEYLHGEAVSLGMIAASHISLQRNLLKKEEFAKIVETLSLYDLPTKLSAMLPEDIYNQLFYDKKVFNNKVVFILLDGIGSCIEVNNVSKEEILQSIGFLQKGE